MKEAAKIVIKHPADMTKKGRKEIANWMRDRAKDLEEIGEEMASVFTARYMYRPKE